MQKMLNNLNEIEDLFIEDRLILFGAGRICYSILRYLADKDISLQKIFCIAVTDKAYNLDAVMGIPVCLIDEIAPSDVGTILVTVFEKKQEEVFKQLEERGFYNVYSVSNLLYARLRQESNDLSIDILTNTQWIRDDIRKFTAGARRQGNNIIDEGKRIRTELSVEFRRISDAYLKRIDKTESVIGANYRNLVAAEERVMRELQWKDNFRIAVNECGWIEKKDLIPGGMAVGSYYLYTLLKILEKKQPCSVLDIGMGQTSKLISQYIKKEQESHCTIVEADKDWIRFFKDEICFSPNLLIEQMDYCITEVEDGNPVRRYDGFKTRLKNKKYDLISIDGPLGVDMKEKSRIDIFDVLPECLLNSWIIMLDDVQREGERNTFNRMKEILENNGIKYCAKTHSGEKSFGILTSEDNRFFCTV